MSTPTLDQLKRGLEISQKIAALEEEMAAIFNGATPAAKPVAASGKGNRGKRSPETIARMKAAQQARWAKLKGKKASVASKAPANAKAKVPARKRTMSPEARAKIAAAQKARWAAVKKK
jgi:hypothetical protein